MASGIFVLPLQFNFMGVTRSPWKHGLWNGDFRWIHTCGKSEAFSDSWWSEVTGSHSQTIQSMVKASKVPENQKQTVFPETPIVVGSWKTQDVFIVAYVFLIAKRPPLEKSVDFHPSFFRPFVLLFCIRPSRCLRSLPAKKSVKDVEVSMPSLPKTNGRLMEEILLTSWGW